MHAIAPIDIPPPNAATAPRYPAFVTTMLWTDVAMCVLRALATLTAAFALGLGLGGVGDDEVHFRGAGELVLGIAVALPGLIGNLMLLRRRRAGLVFGWMSLAFVGISIAFSFWVMQRMLADPDTLECPPETLVAGVVLGVLLRLAVNFLYLVALRLAAGELRHGLE